MSSRTWYGLIICLLALSLLLLLVIPFYADRIQTAIENTMEERVQEIGQDWTQVETTGRDVTLRGEAPTPTAYDTVLELAYSIPGVRTITNLMTQRTISPYTANIDWKNTQLAVSGFLPDEASVRAVKRLINQTYAKNNIDQIKVGYGSPEGWSELVKVLLQNVQHFDHANIDLVDQTLSLSGKIPSSQHAAQLKKAMQPFENQGYRFNLHVVAVDEKVKDCQERFNTLMQSSIAFELGESTLNPASFAFLEQLAETAMFCPDENITIAGHADNAGSESFNQSLSQERAERVAGWLVQAGIAASRIRTKGYGAKYPIADNTTEEGRSKNRRIEFIVGEQ
ncbi:MAG: OmpA family protein [Thiolinea sp.]